MEVEVRAEGVGPALGGKGSPCPTIAFCGKTWKVGWPTQDAKLWHEQLVAKHAEDELKASARVMDAAEFAAKWKSLENDIRAGHHRVFGPLWNATVDGPHGMPLFLLSLLKEHHADAQFADAEVLWGSCNRDVRMALAQVMPPFATLLVEKAPIDQEEKPEAAKRLAAELLLRVGVATPSTPVALTA